MCLLTCNLLHMGILSQMALGTTTLSSCQTFHGLYLVERSHGGHYLRCRLPGPG